MTFARSSSTTGEPRPLETVIWYPTDDRGSDGPVTDAAPAKSGGPFPVVLFSHGDGGEPTQASHFTEHLASWGFVVVAPPHPGNTKADCPCGPESQGDSLVNRVPDVTAALDGVLALKVDPSQPIGTIVDPERTAITGLSFGGLTAISAAPEGRFDAVIAMAPGAPALLLEQARETRVPVLMFGGGRDDRVDANEVRQLYEALPDDVPHYFVFFPQAGHHAYQDECTRRCEFPQERAHELINRYVTAFLEVFLEGDERYDTFLKEGEPPDADVSYGGE